MTDVIKWEVIKAYNSVVNYCNQIDTSSSTIHVTSDLKKLYKDNQQHYEHMVDNCVDEKAKLWLRFAPILTWHKDVGLVLELSQIKHGKLTFANDIDKLTKDQYVFLESVLRPVLDPSLKPHPYYPNLVACPAGCKGSCCDRDCY